MITYSTIKQFNIQCDRCGAARQFFGNYVDVAQAARSIKFSYTRNGQTYCPGCRIDHKVNMALAK